MYFFNSIIDKDPTVPETFGDCKGSSTKLLSEVQWSWLEEELERESEVKIIVSGIQVRLKVMYNISR